MSTEKSFALQPFSITIFPLYLWLRPIGFNKSPFSGAATSAKPATGKNHAQDVITEALADYSGVQTQLPGNADVRYKIAKTLRLMDKTTMPKLCIAAPSTCNRHTSPR